jgi:hypothetical protein
MVMAQHQNAESNGSSMYSFKTTRVPVAEFPTKTGTIFRSGILGLEAHGIVRYSMPE